MIDNGKVKSDVVVEVTSDVADATTRSGIVDKTCLSTSATG